MEPSETSGADLTQLLGMCAALTVAEGMRPELTQALENALVTYSDVAHQIEPLPAIETFLLAVGMQTPTDHVGALKAAPIASARDAEIGKTLRAIAAAAEDSKARLHALISTAESNGVKYEHSLITKAFTPHLDAIFGDRKSPGIVIDSVVTSVFTSAEESGVGELNEVPRRCAERLFAYPDVVDHVLRIHVERVLAINFNDPDVRRAERGDWTHLICQFFKKDDPSAYAERMEAAFFFGGLLGAVLLQPLSKVWSRPIGPDEWSETDASLARRYVTLMASPSLARISVRKEDEYSSEVFRRAAGHMQNMAWRPYTDYLVQLEIITRDNGWVWDREGDFDRELYEALRAGGILALFGNRGSTERHVEASMAPALFRFRMADQSNAVWDLATCLVPITPEGHYAHWYAETLFPYPDHWDRLIDSALCTQSFELAEACGAMWLLQLCLLQVWSEDEIEYACRTLTDARTWATATYGYIAPVAAYLEKLFDSSEGTPATLAVSALTHVYGGSDISLGSASEISVRSARTRLALRLVGERFLRLPHDVQQCLVSGVQLLMLVERHESASGERIEAAAGEIVRLAGTVEDLLRQRLSEVSTHSLAVLTAADFRWPKDASLGSAAKLLRNYHRLPAGVQADLSSSVPTLPWSRSQYESLFELVMIRNRAAHGVATTRDDFSRVESIVFNRATTGGYDQNHLGLIALLA